MRRGTPFQGYGFLHELKVLQETPGFQEAIELKSALSGDTPLLWACENNELAVAEWLVRHWRADITHADDHGRNACLKAAWKGHVRIIEWAMELGCDHLKRSICNDSMVHEAAYRGRLNVVEYCAHRLGMPLDDPNELDGRRCSPRASARVRIRQSPACRNHPCRT